MKFNTSSPVGKHTHYHLLHHLHFFCFGSICHRSLVVCANTSVIMWLDEQRLPAAFRGREALSWKPSVRFRQRRRCTSVTWSPGRALLIFQMRITLLHYLIAEIEKVQDMFFILSFLWVSRRQNLTGERENSFISFHSFSNIYFLTSIVEPQKNHETNKWCYSSDYNYIINHISIINPRPT